jgi:hypothetical protein
MENKSLQGKFFSLLNSFTLIFVILFAVCYGIFLYYVKFIPYEVGTPAPHFIQLVIVLKTKLEPLLLILGIVQLFIIYINKLKVTKKQKIISWLAIICSLSKIIFFLETLIFILGSPKW